MKHKLAKKCGREKTWKASPLTKEEIGKEIVKIRKNKKTIKSTLRISDIQLLLHLSYASSPIQKLHPHSNIISNYTSLPSIAATFLTTHLKVVL